MKNHHIVRSKMGIISLAAVLAISGCGTTKGAADESPGVTSEKITLGVLSDLSGPLSGSGKTVLAGSQIAVDQINASGGVCGRDLELLVRDHAYNVQKAVVAYGEVEPEVLAMPVLYGSNAITALEDAIEEDSMLVAAVSYAHTLLGSENVLVFGATNDVITINALSWLLEQGEIGEGDKIGHVYLEGEFGESSAKGSAYFAEHTGTTIIDRQVKATDTNMAGIVNDFKAAGVRAIMLDTSSQQTAAIAAQAQANGMDIPIVGGPQAFGGSLLQTSAASALLENFYKVGGLGAISADNANTKTFAANWRAAGNAEPESPTGANHGYVAIQVYKALLEQTCEDLTRNGLLDARSNMTEFELPGFLPTLDFSDVDQPSSIASDVSVPSREQYGKTKTVSGFMASELAKQYVQERGNE